MGALIHEAPIPAELAKNQQGMEHICHHQTNSLLLGWLILVLALIIERL